MEEPYDGLIGTPLIQKLFPGLEPDGELPEEIPVLDQPPVTIITPKVDQVCGRLFKYYQNFRVEGHSLVGAGPSVEKKAVEIHGASPRIQWVSDETSPGHHKSVRVDNELYQVRASPENSYICLYNCRSKILSLLSLMRMMMKVPLLARV
jgi:hypothetical protein